MQETRRCDTATWVTLTYEQPPLDSNGLMTLRKDDFQRFIKRLRKIRRDFSTQKIKYYACGEYGSKTFRPHFHAVIFNSTPNDIDRAWSNFTSLADEQGVKLGFCTFDAVNENTVMYTAKYMNKGKLIPLFDGDKRTPEFQLFSKGLGSNFLTEETQKHYLENPTKNFVYVDGFKKALPRYFRDRIFEGYEHLKTAAQVVAQESSLSTLKVQHAEYSTSKAKKQTFEEWRYSRKKSAIDFFRKSLEKRDKL